MASPDLHDPSPVEMDLFLHAVQHLKWVKRCGSDGCVGV